jgi:5'-3' exonuclease
MISRQGEDMRKFILIDGNNLGIRSSAVNSELTADLIDFDSEDFNPDDAFDDAVRFPTGALHGFLRSLSMLRSQYPDFYIAVIWDGGYDKRLEASEIAVKSGLIPSAYKANRRKGDVPPAVKDFSKQKPILQDMLSLTSFPQVIKKGEEADDIIASYAKKYADGQVIAYTNDKDYYQILRDNVFVMKGDGKLLDEGWLKKEFKLTPQQWIEVGALMGDDGDNIFGIPSWGEKTAIKGILQCGTAKAVIEGLETKYGSWRAKFPDISGDDFKILKEAETETKKPKYPGITPGLPYTGVALAYQRGLVKMPKASLMALMFKDRIPLAWFLKEMKDDIVLPDLVPLERDGEAALHEMLLKYSLNSVARDSKKLCMPQPGGAGGTPLVKESEENEENSCLFDIE